MSIRTRIELAAAAIIADHAADSVSGAPARRPATFANSPVDFLKADGGQPIRLADATRPVQKRIPGQIYH